MMAMDDDDVMSGRGAAKASQPETEAENGRMYMYTTRPGGSGLMGVLNAECRVLGFCLEPFVEVWD